MTRVIGGGPVIQVLPGPDAMGDSAAAVIAKAPPEKQKMLKMMTMKGPFSDKAANISGTFRNGALIDDNAPIHVMLTTQTRGKARGSNVGYTCWNCTRNPMKQLHLMLMPPMGRMYPVPGGIVHVMWQKSHGTTTRTS
ncbi:MAG: hypothetical protein ABJA80_10140 [bacterium]